MKKNLSKSRKRFACNPILANLIAEANLLPLDFDFDFDQVAKKVGADAALIRWQDLFSNDLSAKAVEYIYKKAMEKLIGFNAAYFRENPGKLKLMGTLAGTEKELRNAHKFYKEAPHGDLDKLDDDAYKKYLLEVQFHALMDEPNDFLFYTLIPLQELITARRLLHGIIAINESSQDLSSQSASLSNALSTTLKGNEMTGLELTQRMLTPDLNAIRGILTETTSSLTPDGIIRFELSDHAKALQGVNISRVRACEVCRKVFWALRKDSFTCSKKHAERRKKRLQRKNWEEKGHTGKGGYLSGRKKKKEGRKKRGE